MVCCTDVHKLRQELCRQEARVTEVEQQCQQAVASTQNQSQYEVERVQKDKEAVEQNLEQIRYTF